LIKPVIRTIFIVHEIDDLETKDNSMKKEFPVRAGTARTEITPPIGVDLSGYAARENPSKGINDPLFTKALALEAGGEVIVLVASDLVGLSPQSVHRIRQDVFSRTTVLSERLLLTCTHTHSGPATVALRECGTPDDTYVRKLEGAIASNIVQALDSLQSARIGFGHGQVMAPVFLNRRQPDGGVVDPEVVVLRVDTEDGSPIATWINFTCHAVVWSGENLNISADFPGAVAALVEQKIGGLALFSNGACGDINPNARGSDAIASVATPIADEVLRVWGAIKTSPTASLAVDRELFSIPFAPLMDRCEAEEQLRTWQKALEEASGVGVHGRIARAHIQMAEAVLALHRKGQTPAALEADLKVTSIGDHFLVSFPGEVLVQIGLCLKEEAPGRVAFLGYTDGCLGYIPLSEDFQKGGYEPAAAWVYYGHNAPFEVGVGERLVKSAREMLKQRLAER